MISIAATIVLASIVEGLFHQFILHTHQKRLLGGVLKAAFVAHALEHHPQFRADKYHHEPTEHDKKISLEWFTLPIVLIMFIPIAYGAYLLFGWGAAIAVYAVITTYYAFYEFLHWNMHFPGDDPRGRWFRRFQPLKGLFKWFDERHFVHHLADDRNFNVVLPIYDLMIGRYTTDVERIPWAVRRRTRKNLEKSAELRRAAGN